MGYLNIPANGWPQLKDLEKLDKIAQQMENMPTFTSDDRAFLEALPAMPTEEGKRVLTATTDDQGETDLTYETPDVEGADIAPTFSESVTYPSGTLVYYDGILYKFTEDHAAGAWDPLEVTESSIAAEIIETNSAVDELKNTLSGLTTILVNDSFDVTGNGTTYKTFSVDLSKDGYELISISYNTSDFAYLTSARLRTLDNKRKLYGDLYRADSAAFSSTVTISYGAIYLKKI